MSQINPFTGSILQSTVVQRAQASEKDRQIQRAQVRAKTASATGNEDDHLVENAQEVVPAHDDDDRRRQKKRKTPRHDVDGAANDDDDGDAPHIDLTA